MSNVISFPSRISSQAVSKSLRVVVMECPYDSWKSELTRDLFVHLVGLKFDGYRKEYPYGVLPVDVTDFIATHHMVCEDVGGALIPLMAYKTITLERSKLHNLALPILGLANACKLPKHVEAIQEIITRCEATGVRLSYDSSWTIHPDVRKDEERTRELRNIMMAIHTLYHQEKQTSEIISLGSLRFKMEKLFAFWGYKPIALGSEELEPFCVPSYFNEKVIMIHQRGGFAEESRRFAEDYHKIWDNRLLIADVGAPAAAVRKAA